VRIPAAAASKPLPGHVGDDRISTEEVEKAAEGDVEMD
jgi:hypothetical protein